MSTPHTRSADATEAAVPANAGVSSDSQGSGRGNRWMTVAVVSATVVVAAHLADAWAWAHVLDLRVYEKDWGRMLRSAGYLPTWLIVATALAVQERGGRADGGTQWRWRGGLMALVPALTGAAAEVLKILLRRQRPGELSPEYVFRAYSDHFLSNRGMGLPSSHVMVAMGAAVVLARVFPRVWWLWYLIAIGCGVTRVMARAHYLSDVTVAGVVGYIIADVVCRWGLKRRAAAGAAV